MRLHRLVREARAADKRLGRGRNTGSAEESPAWFVIRCTDSRRHEPVR